MLETFLSPVALRGLSQLVKQSTSATSRRFGGKALYLLSSSSHAKGKVQCAVLALSCMHGTCLHVLLFPARMMLDVMTCICVCVWSGQVLVKLAENMHTDKSAFPGFPLRDIQSAAIRWQV